MLKLEKTGPFNKGCTTGRHREKTGIPADLRSQDFKPYPGSGKIPGFESRDRDPGLRSLKHVCRPFADHYTLRSARGLVFPIIVIYDIC